jgi:cytidylate kinase
MLRICPAEKIATESGAEVIPELYESLLNPGRKASSSDTSGPTESENINQRLADTLLAQLQTTDTMLFITGEASTGKTRVTQEISRLTGLPVIDVGLGYRLASYLAGEESLHDPSELSARMNNDFRAVTIDGECRIFNKTGEDVTNDLRTSKIDQQAGAVGPDYDLMILNFLRLQMRGLHLVAARNTALAGDTKSLQVGLTCDLEERARRRAKQMNRSDTDAVYDELRMREEKSARHYTTDRTNLIEIDTTALDPEAVTRRVMTGVIV